MQTARKKILSVIIMVFLALEVNGGVPADSVSLYFKMGHSQFNPELEDNKEKIEDFIKAVTAARDNNNLNHIEVHAYASPDGNSAINAELSQKRSDAITSYIIRNAGVGKDVIISSPEGIAWDEFRRLVAEHPDVPSKEQILDIIDNTPVWIFGKDGKIIDGRKNRLMNLQRGDPYRWMMTNIFPQLLKKAVVVSLYLNSEDASINTEDEYLYPEDTQQDYSDQEQTLTDDIIIIDNPIIDNTDETDQSSEYPQSTGDSSKTGSSTDEPKPGRFALKTNLLYDAALLPNIEIEWMLSRRWSVALEGDLAWWSHESRHKCYRLAVVSPEIKGWVYSRAPWHGMYVGLFGGYGHFDLENTGTGYQGNGWMAGLSAGYMWPIAKHLSLECGIGAGYLNTRHDEYEPGEGVYIYKATKRLEYIGPLKLKLSLIWRP